MSTHLSPYIGLSLLVMYIKIKYVHWIHLRSPRVLQICMYTHWRLIQHGLNFCLGRKNATWPSILEKDANKKESLYRHWYRLPTCVTDICPLFSIKVIRSSDREAIRTLAKKCSGCKKILDSWNRVGTNKLTNLTVIDIESRSAQLPSKIRQTKRGRWPSLALDLKFKLGWMCLSIFLSLDPFPLLSISHGHLVDLQVVIHFLIYPTGCGEYWILKNCFLQMKV